MNLVEEIPPYRRGKYHSLNFWAPNVIPRPFKVERILSLTFDGSMSPVKISPWAVSSRSAYRVLICTESG